MERQRIKKFAPECSWCWRFIGRGPEGGLVCKAYPDGIPRDIILGQQDRRSLYKDDNGLPFDPDDEFEMELSVFYDIPRKNAKTTPSNTTSASKGKPNSRPRRCPFLDNGDNDLAIMLMEEEEELNAKELE